MPSNIGSQIITVKYFDPVDSAVANRIGIDLRKVGIYSGGYLTKINDNTVSLSKFSAEIADFSGNGHQINCKTNSIVTPITVSPTNTYVVMRWTYTGSSVNDYVEFLSVSTISPNDIVIGRCNYSGSTLGTSFDYTQRSNPNVLDLILKVEAEETPSMYVRVRAGRVNYGGTGFTIVDQKSPQFSAPASGSRIDLLQINANGGVVITQGLASATPVPPNYGNLVTIAEVTVTSGTTSITNSLIKDVRAILTAGADPSSLIPAQSGHAGKFLTTNGTTSSWSYPTYA